MSETPPKADESVKQFAQRAFIEIHQAIITREPGALDGDVEAIHNMRVAIRRFRVAMSNFKVCLPRKDRNRLRAELENLAEALGRVRDLDVMISALESTRSTRPAKDHQTIDSFISRFQKLRRLQHRQLIIYLQGDEYANFRREFSSPGQQTEAQGIQLSDQEEHGQAA